jgi:hypothetical protein
MSKNWDTYPSGAASIFAGHARERKPEPSFCTFCQGYGWGEVKNVAGYKVPEGHQWCVREIARLDCRCLELVGDNEDCPVHGKKVR